MNRHFPLVALLPDLWTVVEATTGRAVSQHATLKLAVAHVCALALADSDAGFLVHQPEHRQIAIQAARAAINAACESSRSQP